MMVLLLMKYNLGTLTYNNHLIMLLLVINLKELSLMKYNLGTLIYNNHMIMLLRVILN